MSTNAERCALHLAVAQADLPTVAALLQAGADPNRRLPNQLLERTALHVCVAAYSAALHTMRTREAHALEVTCARLLEAGAALDQRDAKGLMPSAVADTMPRALVAAMRQRAFEDVGVFAPAIADDCDVEWLMDPESLRLDPLLGACYADRYAAASAQARRALRHRNLLERARAQGKCASFVVSPWWFTTPAAQENTLWKEQAMKQSKYESMRVAVGQRAAPHRRAVCRRRRAAHAEGSAMDLAPKRALKRLDAVRSSLSKALKGCSYD